MSTLHMVSAQWGTGPRRWLPPGVVTTEPRAELRSAHTSLASARAAAEGYRAFWEGSRVAFTLWGACPLTGLLVHKGTL